MRQMTVIMSLENGTDMYLDRVFGFAKHEGGTHVAFCDGSSEHYKGVVTHARLMNYGDEDADNSR